MNNRTFFKRYIHHHLAVAAVVLLAMEVLLLIVLPWLLRLDPYTITDAGFNKAPSAVHWLGTDEIGRDLFARVIYGGRTSLIVGVSSAFISVFIGLPLGVIAGYYGGIADTLVMRAADVFMSVPTMVFILVIVSVFKPSICIIILVIGITGWTGIARLIRSNVISVREMAYVEAARSSGLLDISIIFQYVVPNAIAPLWSSIAFRISSSILTESGLSFLGAGIQPPEASWGNIINSAKSVVVISQRPWVWLAPGILLMLTVICVNLVGEGIRDALDPKMVH